MSHPKFIHLYPTEEDGGSRLLIQECDPTPSCIGDECQFPGCSELCAGKFLLNTEPATFEEHKRIAENKGGNLVIIPSLAKMRCIDNLMRLKTNFLHGYWLGGLVRQEGTLGSMVIVCLKGSTIQGSMTIGVPAHQHINAGRPRNLTVIPLIAIALVMDACGYGQMATGTTSCAMRRSGDCMKSPLVELLEILVISPAPFHPKVSPWI